MNAQPPAIIVDEDDRLPSPFRGAESTQREVPLQQRSVLSTPQPVDPSVPLDKRAIASSSSLHLPKGTSAIAAGHSTESFSLPTGTETQHVFSVYRALEQNGGVRGDGWDTGLELTRERRGASWAGRWEDVQALRQPDTAENLKENQILAKVDRYGFFAASAQQASGHQRSARLFASAYDASPKASSSKSTSSAVQLDTNFRPAPKLSARARRKEQERTDKWNDMIEVAERDTGGNAKRWRYCADCIRSTGSSPRVSSKTQRRVYKGIPDRWRPAAWLAMLDFTANASSYPASHYSSSSPRESTSAPRSPTRSIASSRSRFSLRRRNISSQRSMRNPPPLPITSSGPPVLSPAELQIASRRTESWDDTAARFAAAQEHQSDQDVQIDLDVPRTISGHFFFHTRYGKGQRALFHTLHAFSLLCSDCGYCQGMGPIACTLLCYFEPATAYSALVRLHDGALYNLHHVFSPGFPGLGVLFGLQSKLMAYLMPPIAVLLDNQKIPPSMYATKWYITLFYNVVPFETQLRIWDAFLLDGKDVLVLTAVALIWGCRARLWAQEQDFEGIVETLTCFFAPEDDDALMRWILRVGRRKDVKERIARWTLDPTISRF